MDLHSARRVVRVGTINENVRKRDFRFVFDLLGRNVENIAGDHEDIESDDRQRDIFLFQHDGDGP